MQDFFNFAEKAGGFFTSSDSENTQYTGVGVLPFRHSILPAPSTVFRFPYSMCDLRSQLTRALLVSRSINILSTFVVTLPRRMLIFLSQSLCRLRLSKTPMRTTVLQTQRSSSPHMGARSCALCSSALLVSRQSLPSRTSSSYSRPSSQRHRWRAKNGFLISCMGSVSFLTCVPRVD